LVPKAARIAVLVNPNTGDFILQAVQEAARLLRLEIIILKAGTPNQIDVAFAALARERGDALFIQPDGFFASRRVQIATLAARERMPASCVSREMVEAGLLMSYGTNIADMFRQVGIYTGSILKGIKPADLPVIQATKFEFIINLQTAKSLGLEISPTLLARADEVIE
jgi:putative ABC transport system substrate-binding protein